MNIDLEQLNVYDHGDLILGLARLYLTKEEVRHCDAGGQSHNAWIGRLLRKLKQKEGKP